MCSSLCLSHALLPNKPEKTSNGENFRNSLIYHGLTVSVVGKNLSII